MLPINQNPNPAPQPAESLAFKGKGTKLLKEVAKNMKCNPVGKKISTKEAQDMFVKSSKEAIKKLKIEQAFKRSSAEGREVLIRETLGDILKLFKK